jgi:KDO2-lipid IV(A) lauroyltransferase
VSSVYWLARAGVNIAGWTPRSLRYGLSSTISSASYLGWRSKRLHTQQNMAHVLGLPMSDSRVKRTAFASWSKYGRTASDLIHFPHVNMDEIEKNVHDLSQGASWLEYARQAAAPGKGVIVASAHFGSWDMAGALIARHFPVLAIAEMFKDPRLNDLIQGHRRAKNVEIISMENSARSILKGLHSGGMVAIVVDRPMAKDKGIEVTFFGHKTYAAPGPAALAVKAGAAIFPGMVWYGPHHELYIRAFPPIFPRPCTSPEERDREVLRLTQATYDNLEEVIREWPTQWFMFRPFWPAETDEEE